MAKVPYVTVAFSGEIHVLDLHDEPLSEEEAITLVHSCVDSDVQVSNVEVVNGQRAAY